MRTKVLSANQRVLIGVANPAYDGTRIVDFARAMKRAGLTLEVDERGPNELLLYAAHRTVTNDISVPQVQPIKKTEAA
jgi:hypothetical protein